MLGGGALRPLGVALAVCAFGLAAAAARAAQPIRVVATIEPLCMLARHAGGERVACEALVPPGASPHAFEPRPSALRAVADADLLLRAGNGIDDWAERLARVGEMAWIAVGPDCARNDPACAHFWLDPVRAADAMTSRLRPILAARDPGGAGDLDQRAQRAASEFVAAVDLAAAELAPARGQAFVAFHPAWGAFASFFGLVEVGAIQDHGAEEPTPRQLAELIARARAANARAVLVEAQLDPHTARIVAEELGARVITVDPLGDPRDPERSTWVALLDWNARQLAAGLAETAR